MLSRPSSMRRPPVLEHDLGRDLPESGIAAVELVEASEQSIAGDQVVAAVDLLAARDIAEKTAGVLRMIQDVEELAGDFKTDTFGDVEALHQRKIDVVRRPQRERVPPGVGQRAQTGNYVTGIGIVRDVCHRGG